MAVRRWGALAALLLAMTAGLVACDPPAGSGLTIKATTRTTGLEPGDPITIRITGAGLKESHPHDIYITKEAPNYSVQV